MAGTVVSQIILSLCCYLLAFSGRADGREHTERSLIDALVNSSTSPLPTTNVLSHVYIGSQAGLMEADKIVALPGQPQGVQFGQYSGYVTVDPSAGRSLFYYFVEATDQSSTRPLVLWLSGGLGCSSVAYGAFTSAGPFRVNGYDKTLGLNEFPLNKEANVIFLESPAGTGFSYSKAVVDAQSFSDEKAAEENYIFLLNWLERFPHYKSREFFIAGDGYAGHFAPQLANVIVANNEVDPKRTVINLKGIAIGNGQLGGTFQLQGQYDYFYGHELISEEIHDDIQLQCKSFFEGGSWTPECEKARSVADDLVRQLDLSNIYAPHCTNSTNLTGWTGHIRPGRRSVSRFLINLDHDNQQTAADPCLLHYANAYLNFPEVQKALHANIGKWSSCSELVSGPWINKNASMLETYKQVIASGIHVWLYSGDLDGTFPFTSTKLFIRALGLPTVEEWRGFWNEELSEYGGYIQVYKGITFATVRAAGQIASSDQPERSLLLLASFLKGQLPPKAPQLGS